jgi:hypothetical protein
MKLITKSIIIEVQHFTYFPVLGVLVRKPEGKRPLEGPWRRRQDNIKMDFQELGWGRGLIISGPGYGQMTDSFEHGN